MVIAPTRLIDHARSGPTATVALPSRGRHRPDGRGRARAPAEGDPPLRSVLLQPGNALSRRPNRATKDVQSSGPTCQPAAMTGTPAPVERSPATKSIRPATVPLSRRRRGRGADRTPVA